MHDESNDILPSASHAICQFWPTSIAHRLLVHMQHVFIRAPGDMRNLPNDLSVRLVPSRTICLSEYPAYFFARVLALCVVVVLRVVALAFVSHRWHITVRVA